MSTVDSYQGRQLDVIILSAVRSNPQGAGVGFLNDVRRLNVSITRAKRALWILGSAATLRQSPVWSALIQDADQRGSIVHKASARYRISISSIKVAQQYIGLNRQQACHTEDV